MDAALKAEIQEIIELVKTVPESLQLRTLELLLQDALDKVGINKLKRELDSEKDVEDTTDKKPPKGESDGLDASRLPMRVKAFMKKHSVTAKQLERLFHIEGKEYAPIWTLTTTKFAAAQVHTSLLQSLQRALASGEFSFDREEVRTRCKERGDDTANFIVNFKNRNKYFSGLDREGLVSLTDEGMKALATLVTELAGTGDAK
jgi:hypothetical protein